MDSAGLRSSCALTARDQIEPAACADVGLKSRGVPTMAHQQSKEQKETIERVMHEFKHGELRIRGTGPKVKNPKQAIAIALHEAGASNEESPKKNRENLKRTKAKERRGETAQAREPRTGDQPLIPLAVATRPGPIATTRPGAAESP